MAYRYLIIRHSGFQYRKPQISYESLEDYEGMFKSEILEYLDHVEDAHDKKYEKPTMARIAIEIARHHGDGYMSEQDFSRESYKYLSEQNLWDDIRYYSFRSVVNYLRASKNIVFNGDSLQ